MLCQMPQPWPKIRVSLVCIRRVLWWRRREMFLKWRIIAQNILNRLRSRNKTLPFFINWKTVFFFFFLPRKQNHAERCYSWGKWAQFEENSIGSRSNVDSELKFVFTKGLAEKPGWFVVFNKRLWKWEGSLDACIEHKLNVFVFRLYAN